MQFALNMVLWWKMDLLSVWVLWQYKHSNRSCTRNDKIYWLLSKEETSLQCISSFQESSIIESGIPGFPALQTSKFPASTTEGMNIRVLIVTLPSGDVRSVTMFCSWKSRHLLSCSDDLIKEVQLEPVFLPSTKSPSAEVSLQRFGSWPRIFCQTK